jgi:hypothetical protein
MNNDTTHNDTEITDEMRAYAWAEFQDSWGFAEMIERAQKAGDAAVEEVCYRALMDHPQIIRAYHAEAQGRELSHDQWRELWAGFSTTHHDDAVAQRLTAHSSQLTAHSNDEGGRWVVERRDFAFGEEWSEVYEGTLEMCEAFLAGAALGLDEEIIRITRPQRETDRIVQAISENESAVVHVLREHWGGFEEAIQDAISGLVSSALDDVLFDNPSAVLAEGECPVAFLRALITK